MGNYRFARVPEQGEPVTIEAGKLVERPDETHQPEAA